MKHVLYLVVGGASGTVARYLVSGAVLKILGTRFPYGTLAVNILGCVLLGILTVVAEAKLHLKPGIQLILIAGFCGAFTTFSTFIFEISHLVRDGNSLKALAYLLMSVTIGFLFYRLGMFLGEVF